MSWLIWLAKLEGDGSIRGSGRPSPFYQRKSQPSAHHLPVGSSSTELKAVPHEPPAADWQNYNCSGQRTFRPDLPGSWRSALYCTSTRSRCGLKRPWSVTLHVCQNPPEQHYEEMKETNFVYDLAKSLQRHQSGNCQWAFLVYIRKAP